MKNYYLIFSVKPNRVLFSLIISLTMITYSSFAQNTYKLQYKFEKGKNYIYRIETISKSANEVMGNIMKSENNDWSIQRYFIKNVADNGDIDIIVSLDSAVYKNHMEGRDTLITGNNLVGKKTEFVISSSGEVKSNIKIDSSFPSAGMQVKSRLHNDYFVKLPDDGIKFGGSWEVRKIGTTAYTANGFVFIDTSYEKYTLLGKESMLGHGCFKVRFSADGKIKGKGNSPSFNSSFNGIEKAGGSIYFDQISGVLIYKDVNMDLDMTATASNKQKPVIPSTSSTKITQSLINE
jgi:hypothetical protein